jgi:hypothetical protein
MFAISVNGLVYDVSIIDSTHCRLILVGGFNIEGYVYHIKSLAPGVLEAIREQGKVSDNFFVV